MRVFEKGSEVRVYKNGKRQFGAAFVERATPCMIVVDGERYTRTTDPEIDDTTVAFRQKDKRDRYSCDRVELI